MTTLADKIEALAETLAGALEKIAPITVHNGPDYAEVYFADGKTHSTQAMTMNPQDWLDLSEALRQYKEAREIERLRGALEQIAQADYGYTDIIESGAPPEKHADYFCSMVTWRQRTARAAIEARGGRIVWEGE